LSLLTRKYYDSSGFVVIFWKSLSYSTNYKRILSIFIIDKHGRQPVSTDGSGTEYPPQACKFMKLKHHLHSLERKASLKELFSSTSRMEPKNILRIIFHVEKRNVN
jgi:hypothetical protein